MNVNQILLIDDRILDRPWLSHLDFCYDCK
jgi:hypothetical protein